jgi:hypothetical protein
MIALAKPWREGMPASLTGRAARVRLSHFVGEAMWPLRGPGGFP